LVMTKDMKTKSKDLPVFVESGAQVFTGVRDDLVNTKSMKNAFSGAAQVLEPMAQRRDVIAAMLSNLNDLSRDLRKDPRFGAEMLGAIRQLDLTMRALQKTWFLEDQTAAAKSEV